MGRGSSSASTSAPLRVRPTRRNFAALKADPRFEGWHQCNNPRRFNGEQVVWTSTDGFTADHPLVPILRTKRNVTLALDHETDAIYVWMEVQHPGGILGKRLDCGADPERAAEAFKSCVEELREDYAGIGSMPSPEETYLVDHEWLKSLVANRFRSLAQAQISSEVKERKRQVEREAQTDRDELARELLIEAGFDPDLIS